MTNTRKPRKIISRILVFLQYFPRHTAVGVVTAGLEPRAGVRRVRTNCHTGGAVRFFRSRRTRTSVHNCTPSIILLRRPANGGPEAKSQILHFEKKKKNVI